VKKGEGAVNKAEAIVILREIFAVCPEIRFADFVSLDYIKVNSQGFYRLRLRVDLDDQSRTEIKPILNAHNLEMMQTKGLVDIYPLTVSK
jgi:hypothetical protein